MKRSISLAAALVGFVSLSVQAEDGTKLAVTYGCTSCHSAKIEESGAAMPIGPSFEAIAARYYSNESNDRYQELYRVVKYGSSPYSSKYKGKISGLAMPPNGDTISDLDINRMLVWILNENKPG